MEFFKRRFLFPGSGNSIQTNEIISSVPELIFILYATHNYCALSINPSTYF